MRIAFLFIAEAYQCYHGASVAFELMKRDGMIVDIFYNDPKSPHHLDRIRVAENVGPVKYIRLARGIRARLIQKMKIFGYAKNAVMSDNRKLLNEYDAIVSVEDTAEYLASRNDMKPVFIYLPHGAGDRAVSVKKTIAEFDLVLVHGPKTEERFLQMGLMQPEHYAVTGYIKLELAKKLVETAPALFNNSRKTVLYNPHKARGLQSYKKFIEPMIAQFSDQSEYNLIVAPHVKMFDRKSEQKRELWRKRSTPAIMFDPGSDRSVDNSYTLVADIYIGDVSSQVYEFIAQPRPCIFLNAHGHDWRDDPNFLHWHLGEVIDDPNEIIDAVKRAYDVFPKYLPLQQELAAKTLGLSVEGSTKRTADYILEYMRTGKILTHA